MVGFGKTGGGTQTSVSKGTPVWLPGQEAAAPNYFKTIGDIFKGDVDNPVAKRLQMLVKESGMKEAAQERRRIASTPGLTAPAKAKMVSQAGSGVIGAAAKVPQDVWATAAATMEKYMLTPPTISYQTVSRGKQDAGWNFWV